MQENKKSQGKDRAGSKQRKHVESSQPLEPLQDKMLLGKSFRKPSYNYFNNFSARCVLFANSSTC